jgi:hypothetical protein
VELSDVATIVSILNGCAALIVTVDKLVRKRRRSR